MCYQRVNQSIIDIKNKNSNNYKSNNSVFVRKRKMEFTDYVWYLIMQKGRTTSMELDEYLKNKNGIYEISISKQAFSKQRQNLKPQIFIDIYKDYLLDFYNNYHEEVKTYKATIYDYKWFKSGISTKTYCNNKAYSATSPASGCLKEESSAKYGSWSDWGDKEIKKADGIEVETKKLIRYRKSYISSKELALKEWYPYEEFEEKTGKKIEDLRKDKNINVQEKVVYRYRIKK